MLGIFVGRFQKYFALNYEFYRVVVVSGHKMLYSSRLRGWKRPRSLEISLVGQEETL